MRVLDKKETTKKLKMDTTLAMSVCNSCSCGCGSGGYACGGSTCKGCTDKGENIAKAKEVYSK